MVFRVVAHRMIPDVMPVALVNAIHRLKPLRLEEARNILYHNQLCGCRDERCWCAGWNLSRI